MEQNLKAKRLTIDGMTCVSCQNKIEKKLLGIAGVKGVKASYRLGIADVSYDADLISLDEISAAIQKLDYRVVTDQKSKRPGAGRVVGILGVIALLYALLQRFGLLNLLVPSALASGGMGYGMLFAIGLMTSVHCIAMCGGINLTQCIPREKKDEAQARLGAFAPAVFYNLGRVISYTAVGFMLGLFGYLFGGGSGVGLPVMAQGILKWIAGFFMVIMGMNMLGIFPWLRRLSLSSFLSKMPLFRRARSADAPKKSESAGRLTPFMVGLLNGLMPCGSLQSMQIVALASGNPFVGALSMLLFSLGTVPLMLGFGSIVSALGQRFAKKVMDIGAILVVVLGLAMISQGGSLTGLLSTDRLLSLVVAMSVAGIITSLPLHRPSQKMVSRIAALGAAAVVLTTWGFWATEGSGGGEGSLGIVGGQQVAESTLSAYGYPDITVSVGTPVRWVVHAPEGSINGCNNRINIPEYNISNYPFQTGENIIEFTPERTGRFQYSCWMGMITGSITVVDAAS